MRGGTKKKEAVFKVDINVKRLCSAGGGAGGLRFSRPFSMELGVLPFGNSGTRTEGEGCYTVTGVEFFNYEECLIGCNFFAAL